jgi:hypothetical protein
LCRNRELRGIIRRQVQFRNNRGIAQGHRPAGGEINLAPQTHVLVRRRWIPIDKSDCQIVFRGSENLHGENVFSAGLQRTADIEFVSAPGSGDLIGVGNLFSIEPYVGAIVDSSEIQPDRFSGIGSGRSELFAIPP